MSSFNGTTIIITNESIPRRMQADVSVRHIPGGNVSYVDLGGQNLRQVDLSLFFALGTDAVSFESNLGVIGSLVYFDGTFQAILMNLQRTGRGLSANGETQVIATFLIL